MSNEQIRAMRIEAVRRADYYTAAVCAVAMRDAFSEHTMSQLTKHENAAVRSMSGQAARARCAEILSKVQP